jgi:hypothetical protein
MTAISYTCYDRLLAEASKQLQQTNYSAAKALLNQCLELATPLANQCYSEAELINYCKATILLAATKLRLHQHTAALLDFNNALRRLQGLYRATQDEVVQARLRRYESLLIRANQTACTLSRISNSLEVTAYDEAIQQPLPH